MSDNSVSEASVLNDEPTLFGMRVRTIGGIPPTEIWLVRDGKEVARFINVGMVPGPCEGETCRDCGRKYTRVWRAPDRMWHEVMGREGGLLCIDCFERRLKRPLYWECGDGEYPTGSVLADPELADLDKRFDACADAYTESTAGLEMLWSELRLAYDLVIRERDEWKARCRSSAWWAEAGLEVERNYRRLEAVEQQHARLRSALDDDELAKRIARQCAEWGRGGASMALSAYRAKLRAEPREGTMGINVDTTGAAIEAKVKAVLAARANLEAAEAAESLAGHGKCACLNDYNAACKDLDAAMAELRKASPRGTDWWSAEGKLPRGFPA